MNNNNIGISCIQSSKVGAGNINNTSNLSKITNHIYISGADPFINFDETIKTENIRYILCCVKDFNPDIHMQYIRKMNYNIKIMYLPINDSLNQKLFVPSSIEPTYLYPSNDQVSSEFNDILQKSSSMPMIDLAYNYIDFVVKNDEKILVHCMVGKSRSVSMVMYYLMRKYRIDSSEAYKYVKNNRNLASPNESFINQLKNYDHDRNKNSTDLIRNYGDNMNKVIVVDGWYHL